MTLVGDSFAISADELRERLRAHVNLRAGDLSHADIGRRLTVTRCDGSTTVGAIRSVIHDALAVTVVFADGSVASVYPDTRASLG